MSKSLKTILKRALTKFTASMDFSGDMPTVTCQVNEVFSMLSHLHSHESFQMNMLLDLCIVDMLHFGVDEWVGVGATSQGYDRARMPLDDRVDPKMDNRFVVVYHLLSTIHQHRIRVKALIPDANQLVPSVTAIWCNANWYEREAFDLFGLSFSDHPDLRRILTDYGFVGYPMRKDFPLSGKVEMRYDAMLERCIYEPVTVESRVSVPKVIRDRDQRLEIKD